MSETKLKLISAIFFIMLIIISLLSFNQFILPKFLIELTSDFPSTTQNPFELGLWAFPLLISNGIFAAILIIFKFQKNNSFTRFLTSILNFDISKKITLLCLIVIFSIYLAFSIDEFFHEEYSLGDYTQVKSLIENPTLFGEEGSVNIFYLRHLMLKLSLDFLNNVRILPFIFSLALLSLTYLFSVKISGKRISGIIALIIVTQSNLFLLFDTTATYENFWTTFFLLSLYLIYTKPFLSPISYCLSILTKPISFLFFPILIAQIFYSNISKKRKKILLLLYSFFPIFFITLLFVFQIYSFERFTSFEMREFWVGLSSLSNSLRFDGLILVLFFPTLILLYIKSRNGFQYANFLMFSITVLLFIPPLLSSLGGYTNQPYRLVPLIVMFSISVGFLFSKIQIPARK